MTQVRRNYAFAVVPEAILYADVSANAKLLWAILARHADKEFRCYPSLRRLAELMRVSEDTVRRAKVELVDTGMIQATPNTDDAGRRTADIITLREQPASEPGPSYPANKGDAPSNLATPAPSKDATPLLKGLNESHKNENAGAGANELKPKVAERADLWEPEPPLTSDERKTVASRLRELRGAF